MKTTKTNALATDKIGWLLFRKSNGTCSEPQGFSFGAKGVLNFSGGLPQFFSSWHRRKAEIQRIYDDLFELYRYFERDVYLLENLPVPGLVKVFENNVFSQDIADN